MKKLIFLVVVISFLIGLYFYPQLPDQMASHWNAKGEVDGYMTKFWGVFLMPLVMIFMALIYFFIPRIDPLKKNIEKFRKYFEGFILVMLLFFLYIYVLTLVYNLGYEFNMGQFMFPAMGFLFYYCGVLIKNAKRNWFIGIRTPWTLSSDKVWDKTHAIGGKLFQAVGIIAFIGVLFPDYMIWILFVPLFSVVIFTIAYSYFEYKKITV